MYRLMFVICVCVLLGLTTGYLLDSGVILRNVTSLPQFAIYGKSMVLVGGNLWDNNTEIYNTIVRLAGGPGVAKIGIINAASADPVSSYQFYRDIFINDYGVLEANRIPIDLNHTSNVADQATIDLIYSQTGFFFGGGDQARVIQSFLGTYGEFSPALIALHQMFESGAVIAGTSAGCTCQTANYMVKSGVSYDSLSYGSFPDVEPDHTRRDALIYGTLGGLGFMKGYVLDSHFAQRGREGRMIRMLSDTKALAKGTSYGIGVDENTAVVVTHADTNTSKGEVIGASGITIFDLSRSIVVSDTYFRISQVYLSYLTHGDSFNLNDHSIIYSPTKTPMLGHENYDAVLSTDDVFYGSSSGSTRKPEFVRIATSVFDARLSRTTYGTTYEKHPRFRVDLSGTGHDSEGWVERKGSFHSDITSYQNLHVSISGTK
ncbi:hypothetical protein ACF0H5_005349 [Mactra antiquata]